MMPHPAMVDWLQRSVWILQTTEMKIEPKAVNAGISYFATPGLNEPISTETDGAKIVDERARIPVRIQNKATNRSSSNFFILREL
jgi:hypothetical protein